MDPPGSGGHSPVVLPRPIDSPGNLRLLAAWTRWRGDKLLPARSDMNLSDIKDLLPLITLQEWVSRYDVRFKVVGTMVRDLLGYELTGANYIDIAPPEHREIRAERIEILVSRPCGTLFTYTHRMPSGLLVQAETLSFPIDPDQPGKPRMILTHTAATGDLTAHPPGRDAPLAVMEDHWFIDIGAGAPPPVPTG